jgi:cell division transport system permease protein
MTRLLRRALADIGRRPAEHMLVTGTVALALLLPGAARLVARNADRWLAGWGESAHLVVYLQDETPEGDAARIAASIAEVAGVEGVRRVRPAEAYRRLRENLGAEAGALDGVEERFLPDSLEVRLREGLWPLARVSPLVERLRAAPAVADVEFAGEWADRLGRVRRAVAAASLGALALALLVCVYVVGSAARMAAHAQEDEIAIQKLVGATDRFVRAPFLLAGALHGLVGAAVAGIALFGAFRYAAARLEGTLSFALAGKIEFLRPADLCAGATLATLTAVLGALLATRRPLDA